MYFRIQLSFLYEWGLKIFNFLQLSSFLRKLKFFSNLLSIFWKNPKIPFSPSFSHLFYPPTSTLLFPERQQPVKEGKFLLQVLQISEDEENTSLLLHLHIFPLPPLISCPNLHDRLNLLPNQIILPCKTYVFYQAYDSDLLDFASMCVVFNLNKLSISKPSKTRLSFLGLLPSKFSWTKSRNPSISSAVRVSRCLVINFILNLLIPTNIKERNRLYRDTRGVFTRTRFFFFF